MRHRRTMGVAVVATAAVWAVAGLRAGEQRDTSEPRDVTITGKIVDLHGFMTGKYKSADHRKCTMENIRSGVPAALVAEEGLVMLGQDLRGPQRTIMPLAWQQVEIKGRMYERFGIRYLDIESATRQTDDEEEDVATPDDNDQDVDDQDPDTEDVGACCLDGGECVDTDQDDCEVRGGRFYEGWTCESVECPG